MSERDEIEYLYDLLLEAEQQTRDEEAYMLELLEEAEAEYEEEEEQYPLDPFFPDDDYLDAGELWELTAEAYADE